MYNMKLRKLVTGALLAAIVCISTSFFKLPTPTGYIHLGDSFVILSGIILGPLYGSIASGVGSMLADLLAGYPQYAAVTFIIKALVALTCALIYRKGKVSTVVIGGIVGALIVTLGYFLYDGYLYSFGASFKNIPLNMIQNVAGIFLSTLLYPILIKVPQVSEIMNDKPSKKSK